jgi:hypothetical protein
MSERARTGSADRGDTCVNRIEIIDLIRRAAAAGNGLAFCVYEDW